MLSRALLLGCLRPPRGRAPQDENRCFIANNWLIQYRDNQKIFYQFLQKNYSGYKLYFVVEYFYQWVKCRGQKEILIAFTKLSHEWLTSKTKLSIFVDKIIGVNKHNICQLIKIFPNQLFKSVHNNCNFYQIHCREL